MFKAAHPPRGHFAQRMEGAAVLRAINALVKRSELEEQNQGKRLKRVR